MFEGYITSIDYKKLIQMQASREVPQFNGSNFCNSKINTKTKTKTKVKTFTRKTR